MGKADLKQVIAPYVKEWGWQGTVEELVNFWFTVEHQTDEPLVKYIQILRQQGIGCYVATNQEKYRAQYMLEDMGFSESFDGLLASAHLGYKKPSVEFFEQAVLRLNIKDKAEVLFWDDKEANIAVAREFGMQAEHYVGFEDFLEKMKRYVSEEVSV